MWWKNEYYALTGIIMEDIMIDVKVKLYIFVLLYLRCLHYA